MASESGKKSGGIVNLEKKNKEESFVQGKGLIILLGTLTAFDPLTVDMYLPAFSQIQKDFQTSMAHVELSVSTFFVGMAFGQLIYGPLADRFGRKKPLIAGMLLYFLSAFGCAFAPTISTFIAFRLLQALGGCAGMVITRTILRDLYEKKEVAIYLSYLALVMGIAPIIAPTIGAYINEWFGWRTIFISLACANLLCMFAIVFLLPETIKQRAAKINISTVITTYFSLLKKRDFVGYLLPDTLVRSGMFAYIAGSPFVFIELLKIPHNRFGLVFGLNAFGLMLTSQINRKLLNHWSPEQILKWSVRIAALASAIVFSSAWSDSSRIVILSSIFLFIGTLNFISPNSLAIAMSSQGHQAGTASALYGCSQWSLATFASFFVSYFHNGTAFPMTGVILFCGLFSLCAYQFLVVHKRA